MRRKRSMERPVIVIPKSKPKPKPKLSLSLSYGLIGLVVCGLRGLLYMILKKKNLSRTP